MEPTKLTGVQKSAILLLCLGEDVAAQIFESLTDREVRLISSCMMEIDHVPAKVTNQVIAEFRKAQDESLGLFIQGDSFMRRAIASGKDPHRAEMLMDQVDAGDEPRPLETISMMQPRMVAGLLQSEHPQTVALVLSTQKPDHTAKVLGYFPEDLQGETLYRIAKIDKVSPEVIVEIENVLQLEIGFVASRDQSQVGGLDQVVDILGRLSKGMDKVILTGIETTDSEMAEEIRQRMFTFADLADLGGRALQTVLREINNDQLTLALKTATESVKEKIFSNISSRAAEMIVEDLEAMGPVKLSDVEAMQQSIVKEALRLEEEGQIVIPGRGGADAIV